MGANVRLADQGYSTFFVDALDDVRKLNLGTALPWGNHDFRVAAVIHACLSEGINRKLLEEHVAELLGIPIESLVKQSSRRAAF